MKERLHVLIVDDHPVVRRGLRTMLEGESWVEQVTEAATVAEAIKEAVRQQVQVVAMDVGLPDGDGIDATRRILRARPEVKVLVLTMTDDEDIVARALDAGARGYLLKDTDPETVIDSLRTVAAGSLVLGPRIGMAVIMAGHRQPARLPAPLDQLTPREYEILTLLAAGESNARIARRLGVTEKTVRNQLTNVFSKLGVADRVQAALLARKMGVAE
ncbi:MAG TPA: response regulator transcription factor [Pseudonocardiaceae bacterium]|nr:response regulator transcription factor [Pseudonocardiaceae bacterium]